MAPTLATLWDWSLQDRQRRRNRFRHRRILAVTGVRCLWSLLRTRRRSEAVSNLEHLNSRKCLPHKVEGLQDNSVNFKKENAELKEKPQPQLQAMSSRMEGSQRTPLHCAKFLYQMQVPFRTFADNWKQKDYSDACPITLSRQSHCSCSYKTRDVHVQETFVKELAPNRWHRCGKPDMAMAGRKQLKRKSKNSWGSSR